MTCWGCNDAAADPHTGSLMAGCQQCDARALAQTGVFAEALKGDEDAKGRCADFLRARYGGQWKAVLKDAKEWARKLHGVTS